MGFIVLSVGVYGVLWGLWCYLLGFMGFYGFIELCVGVYAVFSNICWGLCGFMGFIVISYMLGFIGFNGVYSVTISGGVLWGL